jgi:hypothetical protein
LPPHTVPDAAKIEKSVSIDHTRHCIQTSNQNKKIHVRINSTVKSYTSMYFHNVVGTGSYTTSTTNMYHKDRFHVPSATVLRQG